MTERTIKDIIADFYRQGYLLNHIHADNDILYLFLEKDEKIHCSKYDMKNKFERQKPHLLELQES